MNSDQRRAEWERRAKKYGIWFEAGVTLQERAWRDAIEAALRVFESYDTYSSCCFAEEDIRALLNQEPAT